MVNDKYLNILKQLIQRILNVPSTKNQQTPGVTDMPTTLINITHIEMSHNILKIRTTNVCQLKAIF